MSIMSFSKISTAVVVCYILYTMSSFYKIFHIELCKDESNCIYPMFDDISYEVFITGSNMGRANIIHLTNISLKNEFLSHTNFTVPQSVINNQSYIIKIDIVPVINEIAKHDQKITSKMHLTKLRLPIAESFNLLNKNEQKVEKVDNKAVPEMHIYNKVVINSVSENVVFDYQNIPQEIAPLLKVSRSSSGRRRLVYEPIVFGNNFVLRDEDLVRVSKLADRTVNISVEIMPISLGKLRLWRLIEHSTDDLAKLGFNEKSVESVRGIFTHTNFYLLVVTFSVAALHLLFDILSFKNDISFWRRAKSTEGLSGTTVMWRCLSSVIIFLYLIEEETSLLVLVPFAVSTLIEFWKLARVFKVSVGVAGKGVFSVGSRDSGEATTDRYDSEGMRYLLWVVVPLCVGGAVYSLLYLPHKSWYSWTVNTLANGVYVFGFLFMLPQLFINYKLKSVAHLPWKALTYKAFNTFIDDFFAFIITMPTSHRLACFRDDIVFVIYLYQKWLYPVDRSRVNEFGHSFDTAAVAEDTKKEN